MIALLSCFQHQSKCKPLGTIAKGFKGPVQSFSSWRLSGLVYLVTHSTEISQPFISYFNGGHGDEMPNAELPPLLVCATVQQTGNRVIPNSLEVDISIMVAKSQNIYYIRPPDEQIAK